MHFKTLLTDTYRLNVSIFIQKSTQNEKKKVKITHKQLKVECIQLTEFMANIQKVKSL